MRAKKAGGGRDPGQETNGHIARAGDGVRRIHYVILGIMLQ